MDGLKEDPGGDSVADPPDGTKCKKECAEVESDLANIKTILRKGHDIVLTGTCQHCRLYGTMV